MAEALLKDARENDVKGEKMFCRTTLTLKSRILLTMLFSCFTPCFQQLTFGKLLSGSRLMQRGRGKRGCTGWYLSTKEDRVLTSSLAAYLMGKYQVSQTCTGPKLWATIYLICGSGHTLDKRFKPVSFYTLVLQVVESHRHIGEQNTS